MGVVYMAAQEKPVRRRVALKIIKPGMDTKQVIARFEAERQALALMDHQNIARVMEAGTTDSGRPNFIMELVHGVPITKYCDDTQLNPRERLELFIPVCQAIQHAHQKGIIHRDIKPSNVLVTLYDGKPVAKVIDFGVAKATDQRLTERTMFTQYGSIVGTLEYMSPEQAEMSALGVDTRSDIYALGVLLYELLTGSTPLERTTLREAGYAEILKRIKEEEPPRPSTRLSESRDRLPSISSQRKTDPTKLAGLLRGELDWIVMKSLEKDRSRRYETANAFARDVERYLKDETVEACPPSVSYRFRKLFRKNRIAIATVSAFACLLIAGAGMSIAMAVLAARAERLANFEAARARQAELTTRTQRDRALTAEHEAVAKKVEAETARQSLRRSLYDSDVQRAEEAWESGNVLRMRELLDSQRPRAGEDDLRSFEWHYLRRLGSTVQITTLSNGSLFGRLSPDGAHYVYVGRNVSTNGPEAGAECELRLMDVASGRQVRRIVPFWGETVISYSFTHTFSLDGERFVFQALIRDKSGREDWRIKVFEWETGRDACTLANLGGGLPYLTAFDHTGGRLAGLKLARAGTAESDLRIWRLKDGKELLAIPLPGRQSALVQSVAFSPDGSHLAALTRPAGSDDPKAAGEVRVWDAGSGKERLRFETRPGSSGLAYSPDGQRLAEIGGAGTSHRLRDARSGNEVLELTLDPSAGMSGAIAFSPDGSRLAGSSADSKVRVWDVTNLRTEVRRAPASIFEGKTAIITQLAWSADGRRLLAAGYGGTVLTWQIASREPHILVKGSSQTDSIAATAATGSQRFAAAFENPDGKAEVKVWDEAGKILFTATDAPVGHNHSPQCSRKVELSRDGSRLRTHVPGNRTRRLRSSTDEDVGFRSGSGMSPSGREAFRRDQSGGRIPARCLQPRRSPAGLGMGCVERPANGREPLSERTHLVSAWDPETGRERLHLDLPHPTTLAFSPDSRRLAGGPSSAVIGRDEGEGELRVWDAKTGEVVLTRKLARGLTAPPAYNGSGTLLALAVGAVGDAGVIHVLDVASGQERLSFSGHLYTIEKLAFSSDGRRLASLASFPMQAAEVKLWDFEGGREILTLQTTRRDLIGSSGLGSSGLAFSHDGYRLFFVPGGARRRDAEVQVWDATPLPEGIISPCLNRRPHGASMMRRLVSM